MGEGPARLKMIVIPGDDNPGGTQPAQGEPHHSIAWDAEPSTVPDPGQADHSIGRVADPLPENCELSTVPDASGPPEIDARNASGKEAASDLTSAANGNETVPVGIKAPETPIQINGYRKYPAIDDLTRTDV